MSDKFVNFEEIPVGGTFSFILFLNGKIMFTKLDNRYARNHKTGKEERFNANDLVSVEILDREYQFRNFPSNVVPENALWCVSGTYISDDGKSSGVLEWCRSDYDAERQKSLMGKNNRFSNLQAHKYK